MAVVLSNGDNGSKYMEVEHPNHTYIDITAHISESIKTNDKGWAEFRYNDRSVWVLQQ